MYGSKQLLNGLGTFSVLARVQGKEAEAEFVVTNDEGSHCLEEKLPYS